jgi:hypothetical protein
VTNFLRLTWVFLLLVSAPLGAAFELDVAGFKLPSTLPADRPAHLAFPACWRWSFDYHLPFGLRELQHSGVAIAGPAYGLSVGFGASTSGYHLHRETTLRAGAARSFGAANVEVVAEHLLLRQSGQRLRGFRRWRSAARIRLSDRHTLSLSFKTAVDGVSPSLWTVGLQHQLDSGDAVLVQAQQRARKPRTIDIVLSHAPNEHATILVGTRSPPRRFALGFGLRLGTLSLRQVVHTHNQLGPSHSTRLGTTCRSR